MKRNDGAPIRSMMSTTQTLSVSYDVNTTGFAAGL